MITNSFLYIIYLWTSGVALLLDNVSDVTASPALVAGVSNADGYMALVWTIVPLTTVAILSCLVILLVFEAGYAGYKVLKWGYSKIPGVS